MFMVNTVLKVLFVEMYVNVAFVKLFAQRKEFNSCWRWRFIRTIYDYYYYTNHLNKSAGEE